MSELFIPKNDVKNPRGVCIVLRLSDAAVSVNAEATYEDDGDDCERHDGLSLFNTLVCPLECGFCFDYARLLLLERQQVL